MSTSLPPTVRRFAKPAAVVAALAVVALNAIIPSSGAARPNGPATAAELETWFDGQMRDAGIPGAAMVVVRDGRVTTHVFGVADDDDRPITPSTPFMIGSLTKSITALAVMQLVEAGRLSLDQPVAETLPGFALADPIASTSITVRDLLDQTSGLSTAAGLEPFSTPVSSLESRVDDLRRSPLVSVPGQAYHYSNANYLVLGRLIEAASGQSYAEYVRTHIFEPLAMVDASTDVATAEARGLTRAHRLWFGQAPSNAPLFRADMVPAAFASASADDMGRYLQAQLGDVPAGVSAASLEEMHTGVAATGLPDQRYGFGWVDGILGGERIVSHTGSTTDMASMAVLAPARGVGVVILMNGTSTLYETLHKPDTIGLGAAALLFGQQPPGTLQGLYPAFMAVSGVFLAVTVYGIVRYVRTPVTVVASSQSHGRLRRLVGLAYRAYVDVVVPLTILLLLPGYFGTDWSVMARIDVGQVALAIAALRIIDGALRAGRWARGPHATDPLPSAAAASGSSWSAA